MTLTKTKRMRMKKMKMKIKMWMEKLREKDSTTAPKMAMNQLTAQAIRQHRIKDLSKKMMKRGRN